jgi:hypothetical protein
VSFSFFFVLWWCLKENRDGIHVTNYVKVVFVYVHNVYRKKFYKWKLMDEMSNLDWKNILVNFMSIFSSKGSLKIFEKAFQRMEPLTSSLYDVVKKDESLFQTP